MKVVRTFEVEEILNPHDISVRLLHVGEHEQFEHLMLEPGEVQKKHAAYTTVDMYVVEGKGTLDVGDEIVQISADMLIGMPPETLHRLSNTGSTRLRVLNIKVPPPKRAPLIVVDQED